MFLKSTTLGACALISVFSFSSVALAAPPAAEPASSAVLATDAPVGHSPEEAVSACKGKPLGTSCKFTDSKGSVEGECYVAPDKTAACMPKQLKSAK